MTGTIFRLIGEISQASVPRVEEILTILENSLSDITCNFPSEEDSDGAYVCQNIPKAKELIESIRTLKTKGDNGEGGEISGDMIKTLSAKLGSVFCQI